MAARFFINVRTYAVISPSRRAVCRANDIGFNSRALFQRKPANKTISLIRAFEHRAQPANKSLRLPARAVETISGMLCCDTPARYYLRVVCVFVCFFYVLLAVPHTRPRVKYPQHTSMTNYDADLMNMHAGWLVCVNRTLCHCHRGDGGGGGDGDGGYRPRC